MNVVKTAGRGSCFLQLAAFDPECVKTPANIVGAKRRLLFVSHLSLKNYWFSQERPDRNPIFVSNDQNLEQHLAEVEELKWST
jgi:hypothetical protein